MTTIKNEVKVETVKNNIDVLNSKKLKAFLQSAMNTSTALENYVPKITVELVAVINEYNKNQKDKVVLKDQEKFDTFKALREYAYDLVEYDRSIKNNINGCI
jgi:pyrroloquinoline quinone (PQQ) biosynthesis protein C